MKKIVLFLLSISFPAFLCAPALAATSTNTNTPLSGYPGFMLGHGYHHSVSGTAALTSENWSGYAATGNSGAFTSVTSTWVQPAVNCAALPKNAYSAYWVGLDGYSDSTVEQIGTEADCVRNQPVYDAWYEMYPSNPYEVSANISVVPNNSYTASVVYTPGTTTTTRKRNRTVVTTTPASYSLSLANNTTGRTYSVTLSPRQTYARSSAEVITEAPYSGGILPLADYGTVNYTHATVNGSPLGAAPGLEDIIMQNPAGMTSTPSSFDVTDENFAVTWSAS